MSLKRLLVGSISLSDDSRLDDQNGEERSDSTGQEVDHAAWPGELWVSVCTPDGEEGGDNGQLLKSERAAH